MAWFAEMKRRHWYRVIGVNMIYWYSNKLYDEWWESLTDEQRELIEERRRKRKDHEKSEVMTSLMSLAMMTDIMLDMCNSRSRRDKYHGVYDENGFPNI